MIDIGALLKAFIYLVSSSLLYPVLFLLVILTLLIIVLAGAFFAEWLERARLEKCPAQDLPALLKHNESSAVVSHRVSRYIRVLQQTICRRDTDEAAVENLLQETTLKIWKSMDRLRILVRARPIQVRTKNDSRLLLHQIVYRRQTSTNTCVISDFATAVHGNIEVHTYQHSLVRDIYVSHSPLCHCCSSNPNIISHALLKQLALIP